MKEIKFHIVYTNGHSHSYDSTSSFPISDNSALFYVREEINQTYTYGRLSNFVIIDRTGTPSEYIFNKGKCLKGFSTSGKAEEYILTLEIQNALDNVQRICLVTDARYNLLDSAAYHYSEWDHENIFSSIIS